MPVGHQITEVLRKLKACRARGARSEPIELLDLVGIPSPAARLRAVPARALRRHAPARDDRDGARAASRELLIADEPTTALDVTIQAQILELLGPSCSETLDRR